MQIKSKLKLQLISLDSEEMVRSVNRSVEVRSSMEARGYRGKNYLERRRNASKSATL